MTFSNTQMLTAIFLTIASMSLLFYFSVKSLLKKQQQIHERYYIAIRDYIEKNEDNFATILDLLSFGGNTID